MDGSPPEAGALIDTRGEPSYNPALEVAISAWIHAKFNRTHSEETRTAYSSTLQAFREMIRGERLDLDAADPRQVRQLLAASLTGPADAEQVEDLAAARAAAIALVAQAFAAGPVQTPYGARVVAATTANRRLAILSSFYSYALRQDLLRGVNPIDRLERRRVQDYAGARPLEYADLETSLTALDRSTAAGKRDLALLLVGLYTGRRLSELWNMRREHLDIRGAHVDIRWPRTKGGKVQFSRLPRTGPRGIAGAALVEWVLCLYGEDGREDPLVKNTPPPRPGAGTPPGSLLPVAAAGRHTVGTGPGSAATGAATGGSTGAAEVAKWGLGGSLRERPVWISLAYRNGTFGHPLSKRAIADLCERRLGTSKVHTLRHTFARALEDAGAKISEIQAALDHESLATTGRYLQQLHRQDENPHLGKLSSVYGLTRHLTPDSPPVDPGKS